MGWDDYTAEEMKRLDLLLREQAYALGEWEAFFDAHGVPRGDPLAWQVRASLDRVRAFQVVVAEVGARVPRFQGQP